MSAKDSVIASARSTDNGDRTGWLFGLIGVLIFSFALPANKWAVQGFDPVAVTAWRAVVPGLLAAVYLWYVKAPVPDRRSWPSLVVAGVCIGIGFPLLSSVALSSIDPARAALILGLLPALTAVFAFLIGRERPPAAFWAAAGGGMAILVAYLGSRRGAGGLAIGHADLAMLGATCCSALSYVLGGDRAKVLGGPQSVCWTLVFLLPVSAPVGAVTLATDRPTWTLQSTSGVVYLCLASTLLGYFAWYAGLARGGIARISQVQQIQPLLTIGWAAILFTGTFDPFTIVVGAAITALVVVAQRARWRRPASGYARHQRGEADALEAAPAPWTTPGRR
jgi:drug/metabolite transporter (DMT)-like permease